MQGTSSLVVRAHSVQLGHAQDHGFHQTCRVHSKTRRIQSGVAMTALVALLLASCGTSQTAPTKTAKPGTVRLTEPKMVATAWTATTIRSSTKGSEMVFNVRGVVSNNRHRPTWYAYGVGRHHPGETSSAMVWRFDGSEWSEIELPASIRELPSVLTGAVAFGGRLVLVGTWGGNRYPRPMVVVIERNGRVAVRNIPVASELNAQVYALAPKVLDGQLYIGTRGESLIKFWRTANTIDFEPVPIFLTGSTAFSRLHSEGVTKIGGHVVALVQAYNDDGWRALTLRAPTDEPLSSAASTYRPIELPGGRNASILGSHFLNGKTVLVGWNGKAHLIWSATGDGRWSPPEAVVAKPHSYFIETAGPPRWLTVSETSIAISQLHGQRVSIPRTDPSEFDAWAVGTDSSDNTVAIVQYQTGVDVLSLTADTKQIKRLPSVGLPPAHSNDGFTVTSVASNGATVMASVAHLNGERRDNESNEVEYYARRAGSWNQGDFHPVISSYVSPFGDGFFVDTSTGSYITATGQRWSRFDPLREMNPRLSDVQTAAIIRSGVVFVGSRADANETVVVAADGKSMSITTVGIATSTSGRYSQACADADRIALVDEAGRVTSIDRRQPTASTTVSRFSPPVGAYRFLCALDGPRTWLVIGVQDLKHPGVGTTHTLIASSPAPGQPFEYQAFDAETDGASRPAAITVGSDHRLYVVQNQSIREDSADISVVAADATLLTVNELVGPSLIGASNGTETAWSITVSGSAILIGGSRNDAATIWELKSSSPTEPERRVDHF